MPERAVPPSFRVLACPARSRDATSAVLVVVAGALAGADDALADRVEALVAHCPEVVVDVRRLDRADVGTVAALARLQLRVRARGGSLRVRGATADLRAVLVLLGLDGALCTDDE